MTPKQLLLAAVVLAIVGGVSVVVYQNSKDTATAQAASSFEECVAQGNAVMESYPRQCRDQSGRLFVENVAPAEQAFVGAGCALAGCSSVICTEEDAAPDVVTTCEYRTEYACYKSARCEKQTSGKCGWTQTSELSACLADAFVESKG